MAGKTRLSGEMATTGGVSSLTSLKEREDLLLYTNGSTNVAGEFVIQTNIVPPPTGGGYMCVLRLSGQIHASINAIMDLTVRFLAQTGTVSSVSVVNAGSFPIPQVRAMLRTSDNAVAIVITSGAASNLWNFAKVVVDGIFGHVPIPDSMLDGWTGNITTDLSALTSVSTVVPVAFMDKTVFESSWFKEECRVATTGNIDLATGGLLVIDGITVGNGNRVLVKDQTAQAENGIYLSSSGAWTRAPDADTTIKCSPIVTMTTQGTAQGGMIWQNKFGLGATLGTTIMPFYQVVPTVVTSRTVTGSTTLVGGDGGGVVEVDSASAATVTVPANSSVAFPIGTVIEICQLGVGSTSLVAASGVVLKHSSSLVCRTQNSSLMIRKRATDEWIVGGDAQ